MGKDDAVGEEAEALGKKNRISDYLGDSDGGEPPSPPQLRLPRFTCTTFRFVRLGRKRGGRKEVGAKKAEDSSAAGSNQPAETSTSSSSASAEAGGGMGLSMLLLLARTCVELNRMAEVRAQMEALLTEMRDEAGRVKAMSARNRGAVTPRTFNLQLSSSSCASDTDTNHHHAATTKETTARQECESEPEPAREDDEGVQLELEVAAAEFEAEHAQQQRPTIECRSEQENSDESSDDEFIELDGGGRFGSGDREWDAADEDSEEESTGGGGVCAVELERRLHELLDRRNRERIEELEFALRQAGQKLREKEMEARLWQDTATLALQPPSQHGQ